MPVRCSGQERHEDGGLRSYGFLDTAYLSETLG